MQYWCNIWIKLHMSTKSQNEMKEQQSVKTKVCFLEWTWDQGTLGPNNLMHVFLDILSGSVVSSLTPILFLTSYILYFCHAICFSCLLVKKKKKKSFNCFDTSVDSFVHLVNACQPNPTRSYSRFSFSQSSDWMSKEDISNIFRQQSKV